MNFILQGVGIGGGLVLVTVALLILWDLSVRLHPYKADIAVWIYIIAIYAVLAGATNYYGNGH